MKKNLLTVLIVFSSLDLFSQIDKGNILISIDGNYVKMNIENGVTTNQNSTQGQYLSFGSAIGYFITNRFIAGVGLDYNWDKEIRYNSLYIYNKYAQAEEMTIKSKVFLPNLYLGYYFQIINKLYFNTNLKFSYGKVKSETSTIIEMSSNSGTAQLIDSMGNLGSYLMSKNSNYQNDYFTAKISPELTYFVSTKLSLNLGLGGIECSVVDWKNDNSNWTINFNPNYWKFGIKIKI